MPWAQGTDGRLVGRELCGKVWLLLGGARSRSHQSIESHTQRPESKVHLTSALFGLCASLSCFLSCPLPAVILSVWRGGRISGGLTCPPREPVPVPAEVLFFPCLKNCTLYPCSGILPGCSWGLSGGEACCTGEGCLSPTQHLHKVSAPVCSSHLPTLPFWGAAVVLPCSHPRVGLAEGDASWLPWWWCMVCWGWCMASSPVRFTAGSWYSQAALHLGVSTNALWIFILHFLGSVFLFGTCWDEQDRAGSLSL